MQGIRTERSQIRHANKITKVLRETLKAVLDIELTTITATLDKQSAKDRLDVVLKLMPYCMPKVDNIGCSYDIPPRRLVRLVTVLYSVNSG